VRGALAIAVAAAALLVPAGAAGDAPGRLLVRGFEYDLVLSRAKLDPGRALIQFANSGEDPHDLWIHRLGGIRYRTVGELGPGDQGEIELHLRRGSRYEMWCSLADHRDLGMEATLRVRRHR